MTGIARRRLPVVIAAPVQLVLGLPFPDPIRHDHVAVRPHPLAPVVVAVRRAA